MFPGIAKTDAIDAEVIARTALGVPRALRPAPEEPEGAASLRILSSQREFASSARTRAKNRLRATLLEADPALEGAVDPSSRWQVSMWIGNTYLDDSGRDSPASLNSTGDM